MSQTTVALIALAAMISVGHLVWAFAVAHIDLRLIHGHPRRHVRWLLANSRYVHLLAGALAVSALCTGLTVG